MGIPGSDPKPACSRLGMLIVTAAAFASAFAGAVMRPVWHDELYTLVLARQPMTELLSALVVDSGPPLHYLLCHALFVLVGWQQGSVLGTLIVRIPSVLAFALVPWVVGRTRAGARGNIPWGPLLVVAWLPLLYFGTEARAYALLALVNALVWIHGPAWIEHGGWRIVLFAILAACLPLLHYAGVMSLVALPALAFFVPRERRRALAIAVTGAVLPMLAWLPVMVGAPPASMGWVATGAGPGRPGLATVEVLAPAGPFPALYESPQTPLPPWISVSILLVLIGGALIGGRVLWRNHRGKTLELRMATQLGIGLLPAVGLGVAGLAGLPLYFAGRTESMVWALAAALSVVLTRGLPPMPRRLVTGAYVVVGGLTIAMWLADLPAHPPAPGIEVGRELAARVDAGDRVVVAGLWQLEVQHGLAERSLRGSAKPITVETVPRSQAEHPGWLDLDAVNSPSLAADARELEHDARVKNNRVWLVWSPTLPIERHFFPAFAGWRREHIAGSPIIAVDLLAPPPVGVPLRSPGDGER